MLRESPIIASGCQDYYANLSNLTLIARSSQRAIGKALESEFPDSQIETASYLILSLCFKEYSRSTNLAVRRFGIAEFETISRYHNRLVNEYPDRALLIFSGTEIKPILERIGACIRSSFCGTEAIYHTALQHVK
jgi:hypothetical protein